MLVRSSRHSSATSGGGLLPLELRPLQRVRRVVASFHTFAAIVGEGEVVTWGRLERGPRRWIGFEE